MAHNYILKLSDCSPQSPIGNKARSLLSLDTLHYKVPDTYICTFDAYKSFLLNPAETEKVIQEELAGILNSQTTYAVRSSSSLEDGRTYSYAGLFTTVLNVEGIASIWTSVKSVWETADSETVRSYIQKIGRNKKNFQ